MNLFAKNLNKMHILNRMERLEMNETDLRLYITTYEKERNLYMNFSVDQKGVWGLAEGDKTLYLLTGEAIGEYTYFLKSALTYYRRLENFFSNDQQIKNKINKYTSYLNRLNNAANKSR